MCSELTWDRRIEFAREQGYFDDEDYELVTDFRTCYVGENVLDTYDDVTTAITGMNFNPKVFKRFPIMGKVQQLGMDFYEAVGGDDFDEAEDLAGEIHEVKDEYLKTVTALLYYSEETRTGY